MPALNTRVARVLGKRAMTDCTALSGGVDWFNNRRLMESSGHVPPAEAEAAYYASLEEPPRLAA